MKSLILTTMIFTSMGLHANPIQFNLTDIRGILATNNQYIDKNNKDNFRKILDKSVLKKEISFGSLKVTLDPKMADAITLNDGTIIQVPKSILKAGGDMGGGGSSTIILTK